MVNQLTRYVPLTEIAKGTNSYRERSSDDILSPDFINDLEMRLFSSRQEGKFLIFPDDVLGMSQIYKIEEGPIEWKTRIGFQREKNFRGQQITIPDPYNMDELGLMMDDEEFRKLQEFYSKLSDREQEGIFMRGFGKAGRLDFWSHFEIPVYHNGARYGGRTRLSSGDVIRIGSSIIFGYLEKGVSDTKLLTG